MTFEVIPPSGNGSITHSEECIHYDLLESMAKAGCKFKVDGKLVSKNNIRSAVAASLGKPISTSVENTVKLNTVDKPTSKAVRCIDTGKVYKNQSEAARDLGIDPAQVSDSIKTGRPRSGYTFERA